MTKVAVVGLGAMGSRIAGRLIAAGHEVVVWNRDHTKTEPLTQAGATAAETPAAAAGRADVVITMVSNPAALRAVTEGQDGVIAGADESTVIVQMSTVGPAPVLQLASALPPEIGLLDAPVLGSTAEAEAGSLHIFVGGGDELVERWSPLLSTLGHVHHVGPVGAGSAAKLVANSTLVGLIGVLGEALALARTVGLPDEVAFDVLATTALGAQAERRRDSVESGEYPPRFALSLAKKDADLVLEAAPNADLRLMRAAQTWLADAERDGRGDQDYSAVLAVILERSR
ncbi:MAG TPA: NAD(P)-dependent oxidoreductase [Gaiellaceae bacterium]|nr:NAD(P)-dependent oxidoreductase [Gaiellaceae bacterium]